MITGPDQQLRAAQAQRSATRLARNLSVAYLAVALLWIFGSSLLAARWISSPNLAMVEVFKGTAFVGATAGLLFFLARRWATRLAISQLAIAEKEIWLQLAIDGSAGGGWSIELDPDRPQAGPAHVWVSPRLKGFIGFAEAELADNLGAWMERIPDDDRAHLDATVQECMSGGREQFDTSFRIRHKDSSLRWIRSRGRMERDAQGRVMRWSGISWDVTGEQQTRAQLDLMRHRDALTGLANEALFLQRLTEAVPRAGAQSPLTLALVDLARFQAINDSLGRRAGDHLLVELSRRLMQMTSVQSVGRIGGDSFALFVQGPASAQEASDWGEVLQGEISRGFFVMGTQVHLSACIGLALHPTHAGSGEELMRRAASALSEARRKGGGAVLCYRPEMSERSQDRVKMEAQLRTALARSEFLCCFQPRVDIGSGRWIGAEALIRWPSSSGGPGGKPHMIPPDRFLAVAEEAGLLPHIDRWMLRTALTQVADWRRRGLLDPQFCISVNVPSSQVGPGLVERIQQALEFTGLPAEILELELTEKSIMSAPERAAQVLTELRALGVRIAIDDFGTGYSSLSYLHRLPIDSLKVDRSFVADIPERTEAVAVVRSIVALGRSLKLRLVAEGVETQLQLDTIAELGCDEAQGFLFAPGLAAARFEEHLVAAQESRPALVF